MLEGGVDAATLVATLSAGPPLGLSKIFFHFGAFAHESTIVSFPAPTCIAHPGAVLLHDD